MRLTTLLTFPILLIPALAAPSPNPNPNPEPVLGSPTFNPPPASPPSTKYFNEPGGNDELGHYDIRYFKSIVTYEERSDILIHLIRSYLTVFREKEIETWIAHGTLLGWWWNGKIMPWDWDVDTQVSARALDWLGSNMNMTFHNYTFPASLSVNGVEETREYLLDVNPNHVERVRGDGMNVIDARWIDVRNGLYIDITGLAETEPERQPGIWSCKNFHHYRTRDIYPLRETEFEGVPASVPYAFDTVLVQEYSPRALTKTMYEGHTWNPEQKEWIKNPPEAQLNLHTTGSNNDHTGARSHIPRSLLKDQKPKTGLANLFKVL